MRLWMSTRSPRTVHFLAAQGRRRIAYLSFHVEHANENAGFFDALRELRLPVLSPESILLGRFPHDSEEVVHENALRFFREWFAPGNEANHPDALFVDDDIAMRAVALALIKMGIEVPRQVLIVSLANEAFSLHYGIPVVRYEFPAKEIAAQMLRILWKRMVNDPLPSLPVMIRRRIKE